MSKTKWEKLDDQQTYLLMDDEKGIVGAVAKQEVVTRGGEVHDHFWEWTIAPGVPLLLADTKRVGAADTLREAQRTAMALYKRTVKLLPLIDEGVQKQMHDRTIPASERAARAVQWIKSWLSDEPIGSI